MPSTRSSSAGWFGTDGAIETVYACDMVHAPARADVRALIDYRRWMRDEARVWRKLAADFLASNGASVA